MTITRSWERDQDVEYLAMANCLTLLSRVGQSSPSPNRVFNCKTCNKEFKSFQALGGHRASHKRLKTIDEDKIPMPPKPKTHECPVCGLEFVTGQALGGHMRRHRDVGSEKRGLCIDLNLTPYENDLKLYSGAKTALAIYVNNGIRECKRS